MTNTLVSICCTAYNHEPYIRQCLDGFVMQKTDFVFEVLVHDDASTDNTANIIREYEQKYPDIIKPVYQTENQYSKGVRIHDIYFYPQAKGKYIALCEGDDYWTDPSKLQKQIDFLEANPEYGMCYTQSLNYYEEEKKMTCKPWGGPNETIYEFIKSNTVPTLTAVLHLELINKYHQKIPLESKKWSMGDYPMWLWFSYNSKIKFINQPTGVYRILKDSASHPLALDKKIKFIKDFIDIKRFFIEQYQLNIPKEHLTSLENSLILRALALRGETGKFTKLWFDLIKNTPKYIVKGSYNKSIILFIWVKLKNRWKKN